VNTTAGKFKKSAGNSKNVSNQEKNRIFDTLEKENFSLQNHPFPAKKAARKFTKKIEESRQRLVKQNKILLATINLQIKNVVLFFGKRKK
jgi:hypothetical protein